ncbi:YcjX family protein [Tuwongella immobilis]|uniref:Uncharacterized protein n=1 Tax=Tuwongella immobilis TaxID=692036 RepID=A0A6C2YST3_9BACT|nr:YcjX family protein [Tuwongella immobilis]VIP04788.1 Uncharacterized protein OS=Desulfonatronospira thiodismutans ASO3-1 GN=Dthio_PD0221 PE=4 SV=1: DUF463: DUF463 [Tuwongella immobilis]VTS06935.1 Uncharacterized protein OS=Desulfonatronospira thiodismutans ASO3-1 GN=Dthio_PD0221 PE=4 SV=1: DUF463: DUF463 [Tuwongella immobilis]
MNWNLRGLKTAETRVGVVGLFNSGKTVLLTSLINHLMEQDPEQFRIGGTPSALIRKFKRHPVDSHWSEFNYDAHRDSLVHDGRWPVKTKDRSQFVCSFERSDWAFTDCRLKIYDLPGERIPDALMIGRSYAEWSDLLLKRFSDDASYRNPAAEFLDRVQASSLDREMILLAYRLTLARLILSFKPLISPSTFLLDESGSTVKRGTDAEIAALRFAGRSSDRQFAPLPASARASQPEMAAEFERFYDEYRDQVAAPNIAMLKACDRLVVLIDIPTLLAGGVGMFNDNRDLLQELFRVLQPGESLVGSLFRTAAYWGLPHQFRPSTITKCAFVCPKMDLVHPMDRDRLVHLLKKMVGRLAMDCDGLEATYLTCSAILSTKQVPTDDGSRVMAGMLYRDSKGNRLPPGEESRYTVSEVPADWPMNWQPGSYHFPAVYPQMPAMKSVPPVQKNLDTLLDFLLN